MTFYGIVDDKGRMALENIDGDLNFIIGVPWSTELLEYAVRLTTTQDEYFHFNFRQAIGKRVVEITFKEIDK